MIGFAAIGDPSAAAVLGTNPKSERLPANSLFLSFNQEGTESAFIVTETLSDLMRRMSERGKDPYLPVIRTAGDTFIIDQAALMNKQKMVHILDSDETRILHELGTGFSKFDLTFKDQENKNIVLSVNSVKMNYSIHETPEGRPDAIKMHISLTGQAEEAEGPIYSTDWDKLGRLAGEQSGKRVEHLLTVMQKHRVDPIGFGLRYRALGHVSDKEWEEWLASYPNLKFEVTVKVKIMSSGVIK